MLQVDHAAGQALDLAEVVAGKHQRGWQPARRGRLVAEVGGDDADSDNFVPSLLRAAQSGHIELKTADDSTKDYIHIDEALKLASDAVEMAPLHAGAWHLRGNCLVDLSARDEAAEDLGRAAALKPDSAEMQSDLADALRDLRRFEAALGNLLRSQH